MHWVVKVGAIWSQEQPATINGFCLRQVLVVEQMRLAGLEAVLTLALVEDVGLKFSVQVVKDLPGLSGYGSKLH